MFTLGRILVVTAALAGAAAPHLLDRYNGVRIGTAWIRMDAAHRPLEFGLSLDGTGAGALTPGSIETIVPVPIVRGLPLRRIVIRLRAHRGA